MLQIPVYLKSTEDAERPADPEFYWLTRDGAFLCRNHPFFTSDVSARQQPRALAPHTPGCVVRYPQLGQAALEYIVAFFDLVFERHKSEAIVLIYWDSRHERYKLRVPLQEATVWESYTGRRSPMDVTFKQPLDVPPHEWLVGDIHSHGDVGAYASHKDREDERYQDGIHAIVGRIEEEPPQFHAELSVDGTPFRLQFQHFFAGYKRRRRIVPRAWMEQVKIVVERSHGWGATGSGAKTSTSRSGNGYSGGYYQPHKPRRDE
jgi:proteasome lid subunit RPN8/RPN11